MQPVIASVLLAVLALLTTQAFATIGSDSSGSGVGLIDPALAQSCGNGSIDMLETCDDNNTMSGDGCDDACQIELGFSCTGVPSICSAVCGDGLIVDSESCDDNNTMPGDGCSDVCEIEQGYMCTGCPSNCTTVCGDGQVVGSELCDDNNTMSGDGCSNTCRQEAGFTCTSSPSVCVSICGDELITSMEDCDDGNTMSGDGCSTDCAQERGYICSGTPSTCINDCGDGIRVGIEECDDGMVNVTGDGCLDSCRIDANFVCSENEADLSICVAILLDLNVPDTTTIDYTDEYLDTNEVVFLFDPNNTDFSSYFVSELGEEWTDIFIVILNGVDPIDNQADVFFQEASAAGRLPTGYGPTGIPVIRRLLNPDDSRLAEFGFNISDVVTGMLINRDNTEGIFDSIEIEVVLMSLGFVANEHPGYGPREVCIVAQDMMYSTTACVTLYFIGRNDDPPTITYTPDSIVKFAEGQREFVPIVNGSLTVADPDHPTRYLMSSAQAEIDGFIAGSLEELSVIYQLPGFSYNYDRDTGILNIVGNATTEVYSEILSNLTYHNNMSEPLFNTRTIEVTVHDGIHLSLTTDIIVEIINVNDAPLVSIDGRVPIVTVRTITYLEGEGEKLVVPRLVVIDPDPQAMIQRATVTLANPTDLEFEFIGISANLSSSPLMLNSTSYELELSGVATPEVYTDVLQSLTYIHNDADPGNPTTLPERILHFEVVDETGTRNVINSTLTITIQPVNDPPILSIISDPARRSGPLVLNGPIETNYMYLEDDPALNIGADIYLRDVDSNISFVTINATGLVDGPQDQLYFPELYGIQITETDLGDGNRIISLSGNMNPWSYERILRSFSYQNTYTNNSVTDGRRTVSIVTRDSFGANSGYIQIFIDVMDRNDGPQIDVGQGVNMDHMITFIENGDSIPITQTFLTALGDEEGHNISQMTVRLMALNGQLDAGEFIFFRTPGGVDFLEHIDTPLTERYISISVNSSVDIYEQALRSIFYINVEDEPTIYNSSNGTNLLERVIVITITDTNYIDPTVDPAVAGDADMGVSTTTILIGIQINLINDNRPRILIFTEPDSCSTDSDDYVERERRSRRDTGAVSRVMKKSVILNTKREESLSKSPQVVSAIPKFLDTNDPTKKCFRQLTLTFNTETNAPLVEIPSRISNLISFDPPELNSPDKFGVWLNYETLVINFLGDCAEVVVETTSGKPRPMFVVFEAEQGDCNWNSHCKQGICFHNQTGCPLISYFPISPSSKVVTDDSNAPSSPSDQLPQSVTNLFYDTCVAGIMLLSAILIVAVCTTVFRSRHSPKTKSQSKNKQVEDLIVVTLQDEKIPPETAPLPTKECTLSPVTEIQPERRSELKSPNEPSSSDEQSLRLGKKEKKEQSEAKRKPPRLERSFQETKDPPPPDDGLQNVERSRDKPCDRLRVTKQTGNCSSTENRSREQTVDNSQLHPEWTTSTNPSRKSAM